MSDPYAHFDAAYVLGALESGERAEYEAHLASCGRCRARLAEIADLPALLSGLDESDFGTTDEAAAAPGWVSPPVPDTLLPGLLRLARRQRVRRRWIAAAVGVIAAACAAVVIAVIVPSGSATRPPQLAMTAVAASPVSATVGLQAKPWGTQVDLICWSRPDAATTPSAPAYRLMARSTAGGVYDLGSWWLEPGYKITFTAGVALSLGQIHDLTVVAPDGTPVLTLTM